MRSVADRANVSVPTVYNLIGGRTEVLSALMEEGGDRYDEVLSEPADGDPVERMIAICDGMAAVLAPNASVVAAVLADGLTAPIGANGVFARYRRATRSVLSDLRTARRLDSGADPDLLTDRCVALASGAIISWASGHRDEAQLRRELVHGVMLVLVAALAPTDDVHLRARVELNRQARHLLRASQSRTGACPTTSAATEVAR